MFYALCFSGWNLYFSTNGFLFREWYVHSVGMLLPNNRNIMDFRSEEILRLRASNDGNSIKQVLVHMLGSTCTVDHARKCDVLQLH